MRNELRLKIKAILFDFDGTLVDSMRIIHEVLNNTLKNYGLPLVKAEVLGEMAGQPLTNILKKVSLNIENHVLEKVRQEFYKNYLKTSLIKTKPFPETEKILQYLFSKNFKLAVVTSTPKMPVKRDLERFNLKKYFKAIITRDDVQNYKPSPEMIFKALNILKVKNSESLIVGDSPMDVQAGKAAGIKTAVVVTGLCSKRRLEKENPDFILKNLLELKKIL